MVMPPCDPCVIADCESCESPGSCGCLLDHADDIPAVRGFKRLRRMTPEARRIAIADIFEQERKEAQERRERRS